MPAGQSITPARLSNLTIASARSPETRVTPARSPSGIATSGVAMRTVLNLPVMSPPQVYLMSRPRTLSDEASVAAPRVAGPPLGRVLARGAPPVPSLLAPPQPTTATTVQTSATADQRSALLMGCSSRRELCFSAVSTSMHDPFRRGSPVLCFKRHAAAFAHYRTASFRRPRKARQ